MIHLKNVLSNKYGKDRSNKVLEKTGFKFVHREKKRDFKELAFIVSKRVIKKSKIKPEILIFITQDSNNNIPSFAERLASELNLNSDTFVTTLSMAIKSIKKIRELTFIWLNILIRRAY